MLHACAARRQQFARQNGLAVRNARGPNFAGWKRDGDGAPIGFAFSDCGDAVAVVRQSQWCTTRDISKLTAKTEAVNDVSSCIVTHCVKVYR